MIKIKLTYIFILSFSWLISIAQENSADNTIDVTPKVHVGDSFEYSYVKIISINEKSDTIARDFTLTVNEVNDTTIVMRLYFTKSSNTKNNVDSSDNFMTDIAKTCMNKLTSQEYKVAISKKTGEYLGIYGGNVIGHNLAVEIIDSIVSISRNMYKDFSISENDEGALRASFAYMMNPENMFEELVYTFYLGYLQTDTYNITEEDNLSKNIKITDEGIEYTEGDSNDMSKKIYLCQDNMLRSFYSKEHTQQLIYDVDDSKHTENHTIIITVNRKENN